MLSEQSNDGAGDDASTPVARSMSIKDRIRAMNLNATSPTSEALSPQTHQSSRGRTPTPPAVETKDGSANAWHSPPPEEEGDAGQSSPVNPEHFWRKRDEGGKKKSSPPATTTSSTSSAKAIWLQKEAEAKEAKRKALRPVTAKKKEEGPPPSKAMLLWKQKQAEASAEKDAAHAANPQAQLSSTELSEKSPLDNRSGVGEVEARARPDGTTALPLSPKPKEVEPVKVIDETEASQAVTLWRNKRRSPQKSSSLQKSQKSLAGSNVTPDSEIKSVGTEGAPDDAAPADAPWSISDLMAGRTPGGDEATLPKTRNNETLPNGEKDAGLSSPVSFLDIRSSLKPMAGRPPDGDDATSPKAKINETLPNEEEDPGLSSPVSFLDIRSSLKPMAGRPPDGNDATSPKAKNNETLPNEEEDPGLSSPVSFLDIRSSLKPTALGRAFSPQPVSGGAVGSVPDGAIPADHVEHPEKSTLQSSSHLSHPLALDVESAATPPAAAPVQDQAADASIELPQSAFRSWKHRTALKPGKTVEVTKPAVSSDSPLSDEQQQTRGSVLKSPRASSVADAMAEVGGRSRQESLTNKPFGQDILPSQENKEVISNDIVDNVSPERLATERFETKKVADVMGEDGRRSKQESLKNKPFSEEMSISHGGKRTVPDAISDNFSPERIFTESFESENVLDDDIVDPLHSPAVLGATSFLSLQEEHESLMEDIDQEFSFDAPSEELSFDGPSEKNLSRAPGKTKEGGNEASKPILMVENDDVVGHDVGQSFKSDEQKETAIQQDDASRGTNHDESEEEAKESLPAFSTRQKTASPLSFLRQEIGEITPGRENTQRLEETGTANDNHAASLNEETHKGGSEALDLSAIANSGSSPPHDVDWVADSPLQAGEASPGRNRSSAPFDEAEFHANTSAPMLPSPGAKKKALENRRMTRRVKSPGKIHVEPNDENEESSTCGVQKDSQTNKLATGLSVLPHSESIAKSSVAVNKETSHPSAPPRSSTALDRIGQNTVENNDLPVTSSAVDSKHDAKLATDNPTSSDPDISSSNTQLDPAVRPPAVSPTNSVEYPTAPTPTQSSSSDDSEARQVCDLSPNSPPGIIRSSQQKIDSKILGKIPNSGELPRTPRRKQTSAPSDSACPLEQSGATTHLPESGNISMSRTSAMDSSPKPNGGDAIFRAPDAENGSPQRASKKDLSPGYEQKSLISSKRSRLAKRLKERSKIDSYIPETRSEASSGCYTASLTGTTLSAPLPSRSMSLSSRAVKVLKGRRRGDHRLRSDKKLAEDLAKKMLNKSSNKSFLSAEQGEQSPESIPVQQARGADVLDTSRLTAVLGSYDGNMHEHFSIGGENGRPASPATMLSSDDVLIHANSDVHLSRGRVKEVRFLETVDSFQSHDTGLASVSPPRASGRQTKVGHDREDLTSHLMSFIDSACRNLDIDKIVEGGASALKGGAAKIHELKHGSPSDTKSKLTARDDTLHESGVPSDEEIAIEVEYVEETWLSDEEDDDADVRSDEGSSVTQNERHHNNSKHNDIGEMDQDYEDVRSDEGSSVTQNEMDHNNWKHNDTGEMDQKRDGREDRLSPVLRLRQESKGQSIAQNPRDRREFPSAFSRYRQIPPGSSQQTSVALPAKEASAATSALSSSGGRVAYV